MSDSVEWLRNFARNYADGVAGMTPQDHRAWDVADEIKQLRLLLMECADELESYVEHHYKDTKDYPSELRRYERDIEPVRNARAALEDGK